MTKANYAYKSPLGVQVPTLKCDERAFRKYGKKLTPRGRRERRIIANFLYYLTMSACRVSHVVPDGAHIKVDAKSLDRDAYIAEVMEIVFDYDDCWLIVRGEAHTELAIEDEAPMLKVRIYLGEGDGCNVIDHWNCDKGDTKFLPVMQSFDQEAYA